MFVQRFSACRLGLFASSTLLPKPLSRILFSRFNSNVIGKHERSSNSELTLANLGDSELLKYSNDSAANALVSRVFSLWFRSVNYEQPLQPINYDSTFLWFGQDLLMNELMSKEFSADILLYLNEKQLGVAASYTALEYSPNGLLALILLLSQLAPRIYHQNNIGLNMLTASSDLVWLGISRNFHENINWLEKLFFYYPLIKSENLSNIQFAIKTLRTMVELPKTIQHQAQHHHTKANVKQLINNINGPYFPLVYRPFAVQLLDYAIKHQEIIKRFGRFPSRNHLLNRKNSPEEDEFIKQIKANNMNYIRQLNALNEKDKQIALPPPDALWSM
jgi:uncharacterized protein (DUF924 family)